MIAKLSAFNKMCASHELSLTSNSLRRACDQHRSAILQTIIDLVFAINATLVTIAMRMDGMITVEDYEEKAMKLLPLATRDYYKSGAGDECTLRWNREAFTKYRIRPRVLRNVSNRDISTEVLGEKISMPVGVSPTAMQRMAHPDGECASARAAQAAGTVFTLSTLSTSSIEEVAKAAPKAVKWFQLYIYFDRKVTLDLIRRAENAGFKALVLTVDTPIFGDRKADMRNHFSLPSHLKLANFQGSFATKINSSEHGSGLSEYVKGLFDDSLSWDDVAWLKSVTKLPLVLKGILTAEDALLGIEAGAQGILVSNHGARQIDGTPASIQVLSEISKAVGDRAEVFLDGGVTRGTDVFKALGLGAKMVFMGRPIIWGLTCGGEKGATAVLEILKEEIDHAIALAARMETPTLKNKQRQKLSGKKGPVKGLRNVLAQPCPTQWNALSSEDGACLEKLLNRFLADSRRHSPSVPWSQLRKLTKEERRATGEKARTACDANNVGYDNSIILGVNAVTRNLEKKHLASVLVDSKVEPMLVKHVPVMAHNSNLPILSIPFLKKVTRDCTGFASAAIGFKHSAAQPGHPFHEIYQEIVKLADSTESREENSSETVVRTDERAKNEEEIDLAEKKEALDSFVPLSRDVYMYRNSKTERAFVPPSCAKDMPDESEQWGDFISLGEDVQEIKTSEPKLPISRATQRYMDHRAPEDKKTSKKYQSLKVKRIQGNANRMKATKSSKAKKKLRQ